MHVASRRRKPQTQPTATTSALIGSKFGSFFIASVEDEGLCDVDNGSKDKTIISNVLNVRKVNQGVVINEERKNNPMSASDVVSKVVASTKQMVHVELSLNNENHVVVRTIEATPCQVLNEQNGGVIPMSITGNIMKSQAKTT
ncbi:hypothetical protein V6N11_020091 [Hibiscus sabdariffa]|uniref:Uncharacterized protein n=1 Tax=Hibiscus sabdariffa TaxID=183260 RepID=A0ABR2P8L4_9ROSI